VQRPALFPNVGVAFWITLLTLLSSFAVVRIVALSGGGSSQLAEALGLVVGFGGIGTLAARQVPLPQAERLGLRGMRLRFFLPLLLLLPVALLASEVNNLVLGVLSQAQGSEIAEINERLKAAGALEMVEAAIVAIGIQPVVSEWFYRGVVQQGLVTQLGVGRGIVITALLYALALVSTMLLSALALGADLRQIGLSIAAGAGQGLLGTSFVLLLAAMLSEFVNGIAYGLLRHYSGSLLAPILLHIALNASGSLALSFASQVPIPGFNTAMHTPIQFLLPAAASVALGIALMVRFGGSPRPLVHPEATPGKGESAPPR
jgi:CAAX protease family protein